jgi:hypothetical protein
VSIVETRARTFDVERFVGDPARAIALLGWKSAIPVETGFVRLIDAMAQQRYNGVVRAD